MEEPFRSTFPRCAMQWRRSRPPFAKPSYADLYKSASADPTWMAVSLITNAEREGDGATRLWSLAAFSPDHEERNQLKVHAVDESRHSLIYLGLLDLAFPKSTEATFRKELTRLSPHYTMQMQPCALEGSPYAKPITIDDLIQMNVAEIRTTIHHLMQRPALAAHSTAETVVTMRPILDSLLRDELKHIAYTARLIEGRAAHYERPLAELFRSRLHDFNQITNEELGEHVFDCSVACCTKRPHCRVSARRIAAFSDAPL